MVEDNGYVDPSELMREWIELGDNETNPYMKFMAYWVAFNMLYEGFKKGRSEFGAIWACFKNFESQFSKYDPLSEGDVGIFTKDAVKQLYRDDDSESNSRRKVDPDEELDLIRSGKRRALLYAIYRVRCNFFHGNKKLGDATDRRFVEDASTIVRDYLGALDFLPKAS